MPPPGPQLPSTSPFLPPGRQQQRSSVSRRRRRWWIAAAGVIALAAVAAGAVAIARGSHTRQAHHRGGRLARVAPRVTVAAPPPRSPVGLALGKPAFRLAGLGSSAADPVRVPFHAPPRAGLLFDLSTGRVLWQRNATRRLPIASLTKMMTALLTVGSSEPDEPVLVTREAVDADGSKVGVLPVRRHVPLESMLYGLLLPSGNDAAVALAQHAAGSVSRFVEHMNREAAKLGLGCTRFSSPSGFIDRHNYSCVRDLAVLAHVDLGQPRLARVVRSRSAVLPFPIKGGKLFLYNNNPMLIYHYPGATGMKTGYTVAAGRCLVATAERHGIKLGAVLLDSPEPGIQARVLLDDAFEHVYRQAPVRELPFPPHA